MENEMSLAQAFGIEELEPQTGLQVLQAAQGKASAEDVAVALEFAHHHKLHTNLPAKPADELFAEQLGIALRTDNKGRQLAIQLEDLPKNTDLRIEVTVADRDGNPVIRRLGSAVRFNRALGLAVAAGRLLTETLKKDESVQAQAKLLGMELSSAGATPEERKAVFAAFYGPYTVRVSLDDARAFLEKVEPRKPSAKKVLRGSLSAEAVGRVDSLLAQLRASRGQ